ncbi:hypothetical protein DITRI_Ditri19aG0052400 [Diplodiscus trichospermus]
MVGSKKVMDSLDSLWFFNNVLTLPAFQHKDPAAAIDEASVEEEEPSKHKIQEAPSSEILVPRCPKCGEIAVGIEQQTVPPVKDVEFAKPTEMPEKKRRRRRRRKRSKTKVLGELDLGFHGYLASEYSWFYEETYGYPNFETQGYTKMPPLNDGLAMKEHLKSWAHAVACIVR